jgi:hypothetical protein
MKMSEYKPKILDVIGSAFIKGILCPFYKNGRRISHHHFPNKIGHNTLETNEADQYNETPFARFIIYFIVNGFLRVRQNA